jgi:hypothetical protein
MKYTITESQYSFLVGDGKLKTTPLNEGKREDLYKKYEKVYRGTEQMLDYVLDNPILRDFNHKYTDFLLKKLPDEDVFIIESDIDNIVEDLRLFDKYQSQLEKKDINQYEDFTELKSVLKPFVEKEEQKKLEGQTKKIYEDDRYLVLIPETKDAACKYGSNTKWCVTMKDSNYYDQYTAGKQKLYYIIDKKNSTDNYFSKVAVHYDNAKNRSLWDSKDERLSRKETSILEYAFPEIFKAIEEDFKTPVITYDFFRDLFNQVPPQRATIENIEQGKLSIEVSVGHSDLIDHYVVSMDCYITAISYNVSYEIGNYLIYGEWARDGNILNIRFSLEEVDALNLGLQNYEFSHKYPIIDDVKKMDKKMKLSAAYEILDEITQDETKIQKINSFIDEDLKRASEGN